MSVPPKGSTWMRDNLSWLKDFKIRDVLTLPGSHDAGMDRLSYNTPHASVENTLTQTKSIYGQLQCGARFFDIRPMIHWNVFYCGHFTDTGSLGCNADNGAELTLDQQTTVLRMFYDKLEHVRKASSTEDVLDQKLNQYVGTNECVIVATHANGEEGRKIDNQVYGRIGRSITYYWPPLQKCSFMQNDHDAIMTSPYGSVLIPLFAPIFSQLVPKGRPILEGTATLQAKTFPTMPQALVLSTGGRSLQTTGMVLETDNIVDDAPLTICLAASRVQWKTATSGNTSGQVVAVYGGKLIDDQTVLANIYQKVAGHKVFKIENSLFNQQDPWVGYKKSCCIYYSEVRAENQGDGLLWRGMFAREGEYMDFATDFLEIYWHNAYLKGAKFRQAYTALLTAKIQRLPFRIDIDKMEYLQPDPAWGTKKRIIVQYKSISAITAKERNIYEGNSYYLARDIDWLRYHDWVVDYPPLYRQFFDRIDSVSYAPIIVSNEIFDGRDPAYGTRKKLYMSCRSDGPGTDREEWQWEGNSWDVEGLMPWVRKVYI